MRSIFVLVTAILALNLGNGFVLAQTDGEWRWLLSLHMFDAQTGWAVSAEGGGGAGSKGAVGSVVRTIDGGLHWKDVTPSTPAGQGFAQGVGDINALSLLDGWVRGRLVPLPWDGYYASARDVVFHTVDGGRTWRSVPVSVDAHAYLMDFINARDGWSLSRQPQQKPAPDQPWDANRSTDGGKTWTKVGSVKLPYWPNNMVFLNADTGWITCSTFDRSRGGTAYLFATRDGGRTWQLPNLPLPPGATLLDANFGAYFAGGAGDDKAYAPKVLTALDVMIPVRYGTSNDAGVFFYVTRDGARTWTYTPPLRLPGDQSYVSSSFADVDHGWVTDGIALYVTRDGGRRWTKVQPRLPIDDPLGAVNFVSPQVGWATGRLLNHPVLLKTLDSGRTWTSLPYVIEK
jgi:photosystem II stability/assembly factor-like uncharacterized protein